MELFIQGMGNISPQRTFSDGDFLSKPVSYSGSRLNCIEPDYAGFIDQKQIRRMSRILKMSFTAASLALKDASITAPDGVITGTGYGCLEDTGTFLTKMVANKEEALSPTPFIQSTHNTIGSQIAMLMGCQGYNQTFAHGAFSFENALIDAAFQLDDNPERNFLVGGADEITDTSHAIQNRFGIFRPELHSSLDLFSGKQNGTLNGEGTVFFLMSGKKNLHSHARIKGIATYYKPNKDALTSHVERFLERNSLKRDEVDIVLSGNSGDQRFDIVVDDLCEKIFPETSIGMFKHLCGEFPVASAFACWLGAYMIKTRQVPGVVVRNDQKRSAENILIINQYFGTHYSLILLGAC